MVAGLPRWHYDPQSETGRTWLWTALEQDQRIIELKASISLVNALPEGGKDATVREGKNRDKEQT